MSHAWLDSLSEDWPSQAGSDTSLPPQLPTLHSNENSKPVVAKGLGSRLPRSRNRPDNTNTYGSTDRDHSLPALSERSTNDRNIPSSLRKPSKLSQEFKPAEGSRYASNTVSNSSAGSVVHHSVRHRTLGGSPLKGDGQTPEWKRRLVYGEVAYGEQRDLFCSAAAGLEDMFKPPTIPQSSPTRPGQVDANSPLPSSPPVYRMQDPETPDYEDDEEEDNLARAHEGSPSPSPRGPRDVDFRRTADDHSYEEGSFSNFSVQSLQRPVQASDLAPPAAAATSLKPSIDVSRKISGLSVIRNEDFSPILLSLRKNGEGVLNFAPEVPADQLQNRLEKLRIDQMLMDTERPEGEPEDLYHDNNNSNNENEPSGLDNNTTDIVQQLGHINTRRGGRSDEGSFRHRTLSPGLGGDTSEMLPEESLQASTPKQFPTLRTGGPGSERFASQSPPQLLAPFPSPEKAAVASADKSGSPLKLFGPYDTFTNQTLLRRISQFEDHSSEHFRQSLTGPDEDDDQPSQQTSQSISQFGKGDLEGFEFHDEVPLTRVEPAQSADQKERFLSGSYFRFDAPDICDGSPEGDDPMILRKKRQDQMSPLSEGRHSRPTTSSSHASSRKYAAQPRADVLGTPKRDSGSEGKRPITTPNKDPTPKRRRTLHRSDVAYTRERQQASLLTEPVYDANFSMQSMMDRKRKEARPGAQLELAHPDILAARQILRPRTPTPSSQGSSIQREHPPGFGHELSEDNLNNQRPVTRGSQTEISTGDKTQSSEMNRKPSIKTQDFVDQAGAIMAMIRSGIKPPSGLASVEESEGEVPMPSPSIQETSYTESTREPFSRPPSRDGKPVAREIPAQQQDPDIVNHLKKYQEMSDFGDVVSSSLRSVHEAREAIRAAEEAGQDLHEEPFDEPYPANLDELDDIVSDPPNIRISHGPASRENLPEADYPSNSSGGLSHRSIPTGSSRGSESRRTIAPQSVSHLIPDQVGSMYLDRDQNIWIKRKVSIPRPMNVLPSEDSEDDPFASIPDLSVDMTREIKNLALLQKQSENQAESGTDSGSMSSTSVTPQSQQGKKKYMTLSPDAVIPEDIAAQAREEIQKLESRNQPRTTESDEGTQELRLEDRVNRHTPRKNMTISFSSPIASIIHDMSSEDIDNLEDDADDFDYGQREPQSEPPRSKYASLSKSARRNLQSRAHNLPRGPRRHISVHGQAFVPRPVSRIDETDEDAQNERSYAESRQISIIGDTSVASHVAENRQTSLSFVLATPGPRNDAGRVISQNVGNMSLSPLSEFTMNNQDQSFGFEVSYVVDEQHLKTGDGSKRVLSTAVRNLVDRLTEVEPFEPNWDDFMDLDVSEKRLTSLQMLDEFCGRLVTLDASKNALSHLNGIPRTVRQLNVAGNMLNELTTWDHLMNLQYIDVSNNELESLSALKNLVHLRSVKADGNRLTSLDGLEFHDGLLSLRARDNHIEELDFENNKLDRLGELDLCGNHIIDIRNLDKLPSLERLKLQRNKLVEVTSGQPLPCLRYLDLNDNEISTFDLTHLPCLRLLHADRNKISEITGFTRARHLDSVSLREQRIGGKLDLAFLSAAYEVRKLFLSGNFLEEFTPKVDFLNLQLLELANCGLHTLPDNLGQLMPNLRSLNLNFNAISEVGAIRYIPRLKKLFAAGNRLADSTSVTSVLTEFPHLQRLDLRDNPMTLGFYAPLQVMVPMDRKGFVDPFELPEADPERDELFASRLDQATKLRRKLYQVVFVGSCKRLKMLDGLSVDRKTTLARDSLMETLMSEGFIPGLSGKADAATAAGEGSEGVEADGDECAPVASHEESPGEKVAHGSQSSQPTAADESSRWNAEDSFA